MPDYEVYEQKGRLLLERMSLPPVPEGFQELEQVLDMWFCLLLPALAVPLEYFE